MLHARQRLGDFEIVQSLGRGGMGEVYEAQQLHPARRVALKVLASSLTANPDAVERFLREGEALARLNHPNIIRIFTTGRADDGTFYFTMQLVRGPSLGRLLQEAGCPAPPAGHGSGYDPVRDYRDDRFGFLVRAGTAVAEALAAAHREQVLHRDLKPTNVMVDEYGHFYLMDFGLARLLDDDGTRSGALVGTPLYMSPEQARGEPIDHRSDVYSLGVLLYELATGGVGPYPVARTDQAAVLRAVRAGRRRPVREADPAVPPGLARVIDRAVAFRPEERYASAADFLADLAAPDEGPTVPYPVAAAAPPRPARRRRLAARVVGVLAVAVAVVLVAAVVAAVATRPPTGDPASPGPKADGFPWPNNPLPPSRQARAVREPIPLQLKPGGMPIWSQTLTGNRPSFQRLGEVGDAGSIQGIQAQPTFALLDYDPARNWYLFELKLHMPRNAPENMAVGVFVGYRRNHGDAEASYPCLALRLIESAEAPRVEVGHCVVEEARGEIREMVVPLVPLPARFHELRLKPLPPGEKWRTIRLRAVDGRVTIQADRAELTLSPADLREILPGFDPRGGVGVWATKCVGQFADAVVVPLASEEP